MALPSVKTRLTSSAPAPNVQDLSAIAHVVGPSSTGPIDVPTRINSFNDLLAFGYGPGPEQVADIVSVAGFPVFFTRSTTTTPGAVVGAVTKQSGSAGAAKDFFGAILLAGADFNGDLLFQSIQEGVTLTLAVAGAEAYSVVGKDVTITVTNASTGTTIQALALGAAAPFLAQPVKTGTGASICGQVLAKTAFDPGTILYTAKGAGCLSVAGGDANGGVIYLSTQSGVSVTQIIAGLNTPLSVARLGNELVVNLATDGAGVSASTAADVVKAVTASADAKYLGITAQATGTGLGLTAAVGATTLAAVHVAHVMAGNNTTLSAVLTGSTLTVNGATNAHAEGTSTATQVLAAVVANPDALFVLSAALLGDGTGKAGPHATFALLYGNTGAVTLSGTPNDLYWVQLKIIRGGTIGVAPFPTLQWAVDYLAGTFTTPLWSGVTLIPANGIVALKDGLLDTGLVATFTGILEALDLFLATTTPPKSEIADVAAGIDAAITQTNFAWGFLTGPDSTSRAEATIIDGKVQATFTAGVRDVQALWNVRGRGEGVPGETNAQFQTAILADFLGFVSTRGFESMAAYEILHESPYTLRQYRRPVVFAAATRKASTPIHENFGKVGSGPLRNVLMLFDDEQQTPGLFDQRFIAPITYPQRPGFMYLAGSPTMADTVAPADAGYTLYERTAIALQLCRIASATALQYLNDSLPGTAAADPSSGAVAGAIDIGAAGDIESRCGQAVRTFLFAVKSDSKASASPLPPNQKYVKVRRDNDFLNDRTIYMDVTWIPLGLAQQITITVNTTIP